MTKFLTDTQLAEIAWASEEETTRDLADRLGVTYAAVRFSRKRIRAEGFVCRVYWTTCRGCGKVLAGRRHTHEFHERCGADHKAAWVEQYQSRADVRAARAAYLAANADRARVYRQWRAAKHASMQLRTMTTATRHRQPWTPEDDDLVWAADRPDRVEAVALEIGRRYLSVVSRRAMLRARGLIPAES